MSEFIAAVLLVVGSLFMLLAALGIFRMPDVFMRAQTSTKAATLGAGCLLLAVAVFFGNFGLTCRALAVVAFIYFTVPVAAHMIGRAAYYVGAPLWEGTVRDELRGRYNREAQVLESGPSAPPDGETPPR